MSERHTIDDVRDNGTRFFCAKDDETWPCRQSMEFTVQTAKALVRRLASGWRAVRIDWLSEREEVWNWERCDGVIAEGSYMTPAEVELYREWAEQPD